MCHVAFKKEEDVLILCNSGLVALRTGQQLLRVIVLTSLSFGITELSQSCSCGYLRLKDRHTYVMGILPCWFRGAY